MRRKAVVLVLLLAACSDSEHGGAPASTALRLESPLPMAIHGMPLVTVTTGEGAATALQRLHGKDVAPVESYVGHYRGGGVEATVYVSRMGDAASADSLVDRMATAIGSGTRVFAHPTSFRVDDRVVHTVLGRGQVHFYYARGPDAVWLAVDPSMARIVLADRLGIEMTRLPERLSLGDVDVLPAPDSLYRRGAPLVRVPATEGFGASRRGGSRPPGGGHDLP